eukprot:CAMPEP_0176430348 /NCGR_PEP_ID=MMETSP0127-20121128/14198_1 /TAXON_ID=938130 /ORGANISM="Platyophrya macrostoma, Strain WH" /LENGTH=285 /DNA_ID=CAMNT_0017812217 /DNA_START=135 /DNA_END=989 /DNA_ORIENTATION=-
MTYPMILGGGLGTSMNIICKRNAATKAPLVSYNNLLLFLPALQAGVPLGILLKQILAPIVLLVILLMMLSFTIYKLAMKCHYLSRKEKIMRSQKDDDVVSESVNPNTHENNREGQREQERQSEPVNSQQNQADLESEQQKEIELNQPENLNIFIPKDEKPVQDNVETKPSSSTGGLNENEIVICSRRNTHDRTAITESKIQPKNEMGNIVGVSQNQNSTASTNLQNSLKVIRSEKLKKKELRLFPIEKIILLFCMMVITVVIYLFYGTAKFHSIISVKYCSGGYW